MREAMFKTAGEGDIERVKALVSGCVDIHTVDDSGNTALSITMEYGHGEVVELFKQHGACS